MPDKCLQNDLVHGWGLDFALRRCVEVIVRDIVCRSVIAQFRAHRNLVSALHFDPSGTLLVTASVQGNTLNVFRIMPTLNGDSSESDSDESYVHLYKLQRGITNAVIQDISFSEDSHWIMISSSRGTCHLFAINPAGGNVLPSIDGPINNSNSGLVVASRSGSAVQWPPSSAPTNFNQQSLCASGPPVTLSVVIRIKNGNSGWRSTVTGAAAAATGRTSTLSGATASAFHNCRGNGLYADASSLKTKYHFLVFSPSGSVIQYVLRPSSGPDFERVSGSAGLYDSVPNSDARFQYYYRNLSRQQAQQQAWLQKRRAENMARKAAGDEPLPEEDPSNPIFKPVPEPSRLDS